MQLRNSVTRYGLVSVVFHWLVAVLFVLTIALGFYMMSLSRTDPNIFTLFQRHKSLGFTILALVALRFIWRLSGPVPPLPENLKSYERFLAKLTHYGLYAVLLLMPLSGWIMVSSSNYNIPTVWFGLFTIPHLDFIVNHPEKHDIHEAAETVHGIIAWTGIALVALHFLGAMKHFLILKDDTLQRMLPGRSLFRRNIE